MKKTNVPSGLRAPALMLAPGLYRLARDVANPKPDKRSAMWPTRPSWGAGTQFYVDERWLDRRQDTGEDVVRLRLRRVAYALKLTTEVIGPFKGGKLDGRHGYPEKDALLWDALAPNLVPEPRTLGSVLLAAHEEAGTYDEQDILAALVERGHVSLDTLGDALAYLRLLDAGNRTDSPEREALLARHGIIGTRGGE